MGKPATQNGKVIHMRCDPPSARAEALDSVLGILGDSFCELVAQDGPPPGSDGWTAEEWMNHIMRLRKFWRLSRGVHANG